MVMSPTSPNESGRSPARGSISIGPLAAAGAVVGLLVIGGIAVLVANGGEEPTQPMGEALVVAVEAANDGDGGDTTEAATDTDPDAATTDTLSSVTAPDSSDDTATRQSGRCSSGGYSVEIPAGWATPDCRNFSPGAIDTDGDVRTEIDLFWAERETYDEALTRIASTLDVDAAEEVTVAGRPGTQFLVTEVDGADRGDRVVVVVDAGTGVFFASANELVSGTGDVGDRADHFERSREALASMIESAEF